MADDGESASLPATYSPAAACFTKLVREESIIFIWGKAHVPYCSSRSVDLVVEVTTARLQSSFAQYGHTHLRGGLAFFPRRAATDPILSSGIVKNYGDGFQLRNDCQGYGSGRLHHVARIHQPQAHYAGDGRSDVAVFDLNLVILHRS